MTMTTTNTPHTPTPWQIVFTPAVQRPNGRLLISSETREICEVIFSGHQDADSKYIVEACNNYERVLDERDEAVELLTSVINAFKPHYQYLPAIKKAKTYLAKLEGK